MDPTLQAIFESVVAGKKDEVLAKVEQALEEDHEPQLILNQALIAAMKDVGGRFERGEFFVPEMLIAAKAMQAGLGLLKPQLMETGIETSGKVVIGTVKGDLHDIGKNLVAMMLEGAGFEIVDLGTDVGPAEFAQAVREKGAHLLGMSALLTTTMPNMKSTLEALEDMGIRDQVKVIVGGAPVTEDFCKQIGADGYAPDASRATSLAQSLLE
jgi:5-methyltetrahydrofolate--homocysteine methyltransferase